MIKRILTITLLCSLFFITCKQKSAKVDEVTIFVPPTLSSIPVLELEGKTIAGVTVQVEFFQDHLITMAEFVNGQIPMLMTGFTQGMKNYQGSKDIVQVACPVWGVSSLIINNDQIKSINDLEGKKVLVPFAGSPLELQLLSILEDAGLEDKVTIDYAVFQQMIPMLLTGKADGICVPEPLASKLVVAQGAKELFTFSGQWKTLTGGEERSPQVSIFVKKKFAKQNSAFLKKLVHELRVTTENTVADNEQMAQKYSPIFEMPEKVIARGLSKIVLSVPDAETTRTLCTDYLTTINSKDVLDSSFFFKY